MASLNGNKIKDTYQGLLKTIDNNTATGTLKEITDGQGNALGVHIGTAGDMLLEGGLEVQGTIDSTGGNKVSFFFDNQSSFPDATTYHGAIAHSHADGKMYFAHSGAWVELALASDITSITVDGVTLENDPTNGLQIKDDSIAYSKLASEFTEASAMSTDDVDWSTATVFTKTLSADTTLTFSNVTTGIAKTLVISGDFTLTLPAEVILLNGTYSGTATKNFIQLISTNGSSEIIATISNHI